MTLPDVPARALHSEEVDDSLRLLCAAFDLDEEAAGPLYRRDPYFDLSHKRALFLADGRMASCLTVIPAHLRIGNAIVPLGGVAGVATPPAFQRQGCASALLRATVPQLADELGYGVSALFALTPGLYRRFGWETASQSVLWSASPADLPFCPDADRIRPLMPSDWDAVHDLHGRLTQNRTGAFVRDARRWQIIQLPTPGAEAFVCEDADSHLSGYLLAERLSDTLEIREMHGATLQARRALVGFLARQSEVIEWPAAPEDLRLFGLPLASSLTLVPGLMLRLTDLEMALRLVHAANFVPVLQETEQTLTIQATDALRPANERPLCLTPQGVEAGRTNDNARISADIRVLAALYAGFQTPVQAQMQGLLQSSSPAALALAERLFPFRSPYVALPDQF